MGGEVRQARPAGSGRWHNSRLLRAAIGLVVLGFIVATAWDLALRWQPGTLSLSPLPIIASLGALVAASFVQALGWRALLERMAQHPVPIRPVLSVYMAGQLARYTPGKVALPLVRIAGAGRMGVPGALVASSVGIEVISWITVGTTLGATALLLSGGPMGGVSERLGPWSWIAIALGLGFVAALSSLDRRRLPAVVLRWIRAEGMGPLLPWRLPLLQAISWAGWLLHGYWLVLGVGAAAPLALSSAGLFVLAPVAGFLALVAPGGLGVREAMLSLSLAPALGAPAALAAAVLSRIASLGADLVAWLIARWLEHR